MLHNHLKECIGALIFLVTMFYVFHVKTAKKIDEKILYKKDKTFIEDYEEFWTKDKKVS